MENILQQLPKDNKNLVISVYYDDFARYFLSLEPVLITRGYKILYVCSEYSGYLYLKLHSGQKTVFINKLFCTKGQDESLFLDGNAKLFYERICSDYAFHKIANEYASVSSYLGSILPSNFFAVLSGDSRLVESILAKKSIKTLFFEQGPFNTSTLSPNGVNANMLGDKSFVLQSDFRSVPQEFYLHRQKKINRYYFRVTDYIYYLICKLFGLTFEYERVGRVPFKDKFKKILFNKKKSNTKLTNKKNKKTLLIALQVSADVNSILHASNSVNSLALIDYIFTFRERFNLLVRLHPMEKSEINNGIRERCDKSGISISTDELISDIKYADAVVTVNSTVGIESLIRGVPVIAFGRSYWMNLPGVLQCSLDDYNQYNFAEEVDLLIKTEFDKKAIVKFITESFVPGHFQYESQYQNVVAEEIANYFEE